MKPTVTVAASSGFKWRLVIAYDGTRYSGFFFSGSPIYQFSSFLVVAATALCFLLELLMFVYLFSWNKILIRQKHNKVNISTNKSQLRKVETGLLFYEWLVLSYRTY